MNEAEQKMMHEHFLYWKGRQDKDEVIVFGPVLDPAGVYGMGVIEAADDAGAQAFAAADPAIRSGRGFSYEFYPMRAVTRETTSYFEREVSHG